MSHCLGIVYVAIADTVFQPEETRCNTWLLLSTLFSYHMSAYQMNIDTVGHFLNAGAEAPCSEGFPMCPRVEDMTTHNFLLNKT